MSERWPKGPSAEVLAAQRVVELLQLRAAAQPDALAYTYIHGEGLEREHETAVSYAQVFDQARRAATLLLEHLKPGDFAPLLFGSGLDFIRAFLGCQVAGLVPVPVMPPRDASPGELGRIQAILQDVDAKLIVTTPQLAMLGQAAFGGASPWAWLTLEGLEAAPRAEPVSRAEAGELALLQYTSGSTSAPRGVMVGHDNLMHNLGSIYWAERNDAETVSVSWLPMSHDMGLIDGVLEPLYSGHPAYLMSPLAFLKRPLSWLETISRVGATVSGGPNFAYALVLRRLGAGPLPDLDLRRWRFAYNASEPVQPDTLEAFAARLAPLGFRREALHPLYGMAEATLGVSGGRAGPGPRTQRRIDGRGERSVVSCGRPDPDMRVAVVDPVTRRRAPAGEEGELWLAGPSVTRGYWRRPEDSERVFGATLEGPGGEAEPGRWLRSGDLGFVVDGDLFISGRLKELIVSRGRNVHPPDIEHSAEGAHPMLRGGGAAAFCVPGEEESVGLVVELSREAVAAKPDAAQLQAIAQAVRRAVVRGHGVPVSAVVLVKPGVIPRTTSGKRQRLRVAKLWQAGRLSPLATLQREAHPGEAHPDEAEAHGQAKAPGWLKAQVAELLGLPPSEVDGGRTLPELGLDSVMTLELLMDLDAQGEGLPVSALLGLSVDALEESLLEHAPRPPAPWLEDAALPEDLLSHDPHGHDPHSHGQHSHGQHSHGHHSAQAAPTALPKRALLTGATGFLGGHIAVELLSSTDARILCLVRGEHAERRLLKALATHPGWRPEWGARVQAVSGSLTASGLGLSPEGRRALTEDLDCIYHAAAMVNWVYPYSALAPSNVGGTLELLRLAAERSTPFVYVSTLACAWSLTAAEEVSEDTDPMGHIEGIHLDYVRSKAVAESLVRQAGARGLPVSVVRPGLIFSNTDTGEHSAGDFLSALLRGCIQMGAAPDLDWALDVCPVDEVARAAVHHTRSGQTLHLEGADRRSWRSVVLWMNLRGYPVRLLPYDAWCERLEAHAREPDAALRPLRAFFTQPVKGLGGLRLPQLYEEPRRNAISSARSEEALAGLPRRPLDAALLDRSFAGMVASGYLPAAAPLQAAPSVGGPLAEAPPHGTSDTVALAFFERSLRAHRGDPALQVREAEPLPWSSGAAGPRHSVVGELASWRYGGAAGVTRYRLHLTRGDGGEEGLSVVLKAQVPGHAAVDIAGEVAALCSEALGEAWRAHRGRSEVLRSDLREAALYTEADPRFAALTPIVYGVEAPLLLLEDLRGAPLLDSADRPGAWTPDDVRAAIRGLAQLHALRLGQPGDEPWQAPRRDRESLMAQAPLWEALADYAFTRPFGRWLGPKGRARHAALREGLGDWAALADRLPRTLIHNDFSPRNITLRADGRLCAYDWELAAAGLPQRDLAELLCFTASPDLRAEELDALLELHRAALSAASGQALDPADWRAGFGAAMADLMLTRLPMYAMIDAFRPQRFLERVVDTWLRLDTFNTENMVHRGPA